MVVVADASVAIRGDLSGFRGDLKAAEKDTRTLGTRLKDALSPKNIALGAGAFGIGLGVRSLVGYAGDAAAAFSELQQTQRTTDEVFGKSAGVIEDWAERAAQAAGMSKQTVFQAASVMGQTLLNMGFSADEAAERVVQLQQRASEMAIAFGTTPERAILAITAAMRGERDTIEKFGVSIKQADVNSRVLALGLDTSTAAAKKNSESIAILDLIMEQTSGRAGRFAEGQEDVAVKMAQARAEIDNFEVEVGQAVASIELGAVKTLGFFGDIGEGFGGVVDDFAAEWGTQHDTIQRLAEETGVSFSVMRDQIQDAMDLSGLSFPEVAATFSIEGGHVSDLIEEEYQAGALAAGAGVAAMANQIKLGGPVVAAEAGKVAGMFPSEIQARVNEIRQAGMDSVIAYAAGIIEKQNDPMLAMEALAKANEEVLTEAEEIARLKGQLTSTELANGLNDKRYEVRIAAQAARAVIEDRLKDLDAYGWGFNVAGTFAAGMEAGIDRVRRASVAVGSATGGAIRIESEPPDHSSPLYGITKWGGNLVKTFAEGMYSELGTASAAGSALAGALVPSLGRRSIGMTGASGSLSRGAGGDTFNVTVPVQGLVYGRNSSEIGSAVKRYATSGKLERERRIVNR